MMADHAFADPPCDLLPEKIAASGAVEPRARCHDPAADLPQLEFKMCLRHRRFFQ
jgi:hypothetical protein